MSMTIVKGLCHSVLSNVDILSGQRMEDCSAVCKYVLYLEIRQRVECEHHRADHNEADRDDGHDLEI